jgi:mannose-1-phosphate guanylyltransferase / mannose-6-phosphate isomerase
MPLTYCLPRLRRLQQELTNFMSTDQVVVVVLSGGSGSRLWPISRDTHPKQLVSLNGGDTLLQATMRRAFDCPTLAQARSIVVCQESYRFVIAQQLETLNLQTRIILEPVGRNTAPALALAALQALEEIPNTEDAILVVMPSDHALLQPNGLEPALSRAVELARLGFVVTLGVKPTGPETGFGYIRSGDALAGSSIASSWTVDQFSEKPSAELAQSFLAAGGYLWNAGIFVLRASVWLAALKICRPDISECVSSAWASRSQDIDFVRVPLDAFAQSPSESIDYAVMEPIAPSKAKPAIGLPNAAVVALDAGWSDVGSWTAVWDFFIGDCAASSGGLQWRGKSDHYRNSRRSFSHE